MQDQENQASPNPDEELASAQPSTPAEPAPQGASNLEEQLAATEAKLAEMHEAFLRAKAEGDNIRRRAQEDVAKAHKFAVESFAEAMVPAEQEANTVVAVLQKGYMIAERLLRPAIVTAAQPK